jgi:hypothetical protein
MAYKRKYSNRRFKKRATRLGRRTRKGPRTFKARVTQVLMKKVETKMYNFAQENIQLQHNIGRNSNAAPPLITFSSMSNFFNIWAGIGKGTASFQRIGDRITPRGMLLKIFYANKSDRVNSMFRVIIARVPKAINATATLVDNVDPFEKTLQLGTNGNKLLMNPDKDRGIKFLYDKIHRCGAQQFNHFNQGKEYTKYFRIYIKSNKSRDIIYDSTGSSQIVNNPILMWIIPYEQYGTLETDIVASCSYEGKLYYKDV